MNRRERRAKGTSKDDGAILLREARELIRLGRRAEAEALYRKALKADPRSVPALIGLGISAIEQDDLAAADTLLSRAATLAPGNCVPHALLAPVKMDLRQTASALECAARALALSPSAAILQRMGSLYREAGQIDRARDCYEKSILLQPDYIPAYFGLVTVRKLKQDDTDFQRLLALKDKASSLPPDMQIALHFTLGRAFLDQDHAENAFRHYAEGNRLKRSTISYDPALFETHVDNIIRLFSRDIVKKLAGTAARQESPVFVVGMPRSGSTLIDQILSSHPDVRSAGEARFLAGCVPAYPNTETPGLLQAGAPSITKRFIDEMTPKMLDGIADKYLELIKPVAEGAPRVVDKMLYNFFWIGILRLSLPNAKIIHCTRDPLDMGLSIWQLLFSDGTQWAYDQREIARYYRAYRKLMAHWESLFPGDIYEANYEKMIADQEGESRRLLAFCGLTWDDRCLKFHENSRAVSTWSGAQVRRPIYTDSVKKWKKYERYLGPLIEELADNP